MNILLVYPTYLDKTGRPVKYRKALLPPLSLALLDGLTPSRHNVTIINDLVESIDFSKPYDLVGITAMSLQADRAYQIADAFWKRGTKVIMGGMHPTVLPDEAKQYADTVVIGEVESLWEQILDDCEHDMLDDFYQDTSFPDLKKLLIPKWDNMNMSIYSKPFGAKFPIIPLFTTRGCPFGCKFCTVTKYYGKSYRFKPISHIMQEIDAARTKAFFFVDDNIACNVDYSRELFRALTKKNIRWMSQVSTRVVENPDLLDLAAKAGCTMLLVGIESINEASLKSVNKGFNNIKRYEELIARMYRAGIIPFLSFIFGFDEDIPDQFQVTLEFLKKNHVMLAVFWILSPPIGTKLFLEMKNDGRIKPFTWSMADGTNLIFEPRSISETQLYESYWRLFQEFYSLEYSRKVNQELKQFGDFSPGLFYQIYARKKVNNYEHPFSGGIDRIR
jgi:radical SAM superfamily enzyme YgiQ (UPF0313 family)